MKQISCDVAVIGAGSAGLAAHHAASVDGASVMLIESGAPGTTCARVGCMPSKLLIAAADVAHQAATASVFGVETAPVRIDGRVVMSRVRAERDRFVRSVLQSCERIPQHGKLQGQARFVDAHTLQIDDHTRLHARAVVIATGSRASVPDVFAAVAHRVLTNESLFERDTLPASVAVIGAGAVGLELGQALHRLGVRTAIFDHDDRIGGLQDETLNRAAHRIFGREVELHLGVELEVSAVDDGVRLQWSGGAAEFDYVLVAAGRPPRLDELDLPRSGLPLDRHGVPEFDVRTLRCADRDVFIAGDAGAWRPLLHEAADAGAIAGANALRVARGQPVQAQERRTPLAIVFSDPQIAVIGDTQAHRHRLVGRADFGDQGRARVMNRHNGCLQLYADAGSGRITGAELIAPAAEHLSHLIAWAVQRQARVGDLLSLPFYHPTLEEALRTALRDLCVQLCIAPDVRAHSMEYGPAV